MKKTKIAMTLMIVLVVACTLLFAACQVKLESISITGAAEVQVGSSITLTATKDPSTYEGTIVWSSASDATATVTQSGVVTGVAAGTVKIKATLDGIVGEHSVTVTAVPVVDPLPAYKTTKIAELTTARATYVDADYSTANLAILQGFVTSGTTAINAATSTGAVDTALATAKAGMAGVPTIVETNSVDEFKKDHSAVLLLTVETPTGTVATGVREVAYTDELAVQLALADYDRLSSRVQGQLSDEKALLDSLLVKIDEIYLVTYKSGQISVITNLAKTYTSSVYYTADLLNIQEMFTQAKLDIADAESAAEVDAIVVAVKANVGKVLKITELNAISGFPSTYEDVLALTVATITLDDKIELEIAIAAFENLSSNVRNSLASIKATFDSLSAQIDVLELANKKVALVLELEAYIGVLDKDDYNTANWNVITNLISTAKSGVNSSTTTVGAYAIVIKAIADCDAVLDRIEEGIVADFNAKYETILALTTSTVAISNKGLIGDARTEISGFGTDVKAFLKSTDTALKALETQIAVLERAKLVTDANRDLDAIVAGLTRSNYGTETWQDILDIVAEAKVEIAKQAAKPQTGTGSVTNVQLDAFINGTITSGVGVTPITRDNTGIIYLTNVDITTNVATRTAEAAWATDTTKTSVSNVDIIASLAASIASSPVTSANIADYQRFVNGYYALSTESKANVASTIGAGAIHSGNGANLGEAVAKIAGWVGTFESTAANYHADLTAAVAVVVTYPTSNDAGGNNPDQQVAVNLAKVQLGIDQIELLTTDGQTKLATVLESLEKKLVDLVANQLAAHKTAAKSALDALVVASTGANNSTLYSTSNFAKVTALISEYKVKIDAALSINKATSADTKTNGVAEILSAGTTAINGVMLETSKVAYNTFLLNQADVLALTVANVKVSNSTKVAGAITAYSNLTANVKANLTSEYAHLQLLQLQITRLAIQEIVDSYNLILAGKVSGLYVVDYYAANWGQIVGIINGELSTISTALGSIVLTQSTADIQSDTTTVLNGALSRSAGVMSAYKAIDTIYVIVVENDGFENAYSDVLDLKITAILAGLGTGDPVAIGDRDDVEEAIAVFNSYSFAIRDELASIGDHLNALLAQIEVLELTVYKNAQKDALQNIIVYDAVEVKYYAVDYSTVNWAKFTTVINKAISSVKDEGIYHADVKTKEDVDAIIAAAKVELAAIKTIAQEVAAFKAVVGSTLSVAIPTLTNANYPTYLAIVNAYDALSTDAVRVAASLSVTNILSYNASSNNLLHVMGSTSLGANDSSATTKLILLVNAFESKAGSVTDAETFLWKFADLFDVTTTVESIEPATYVGNHVELVEKARAAFDKLSAVTQGSLKYDLSNFVKDFIEDCEAEIARINLAAYVTEQVNALNIIRDGLGTKYSDTNKGTITGWINDATNTSDGTIYVLNPWATNYDGAAGGPLTKAIVDAAVKVITDKIDATLTRSEDRIVSSFETYFYDVIQFIGATNDPTVIINYKSDIKAALAEFKTFSDKIQGELETNGISESDFDDLLVEVKAAEKASRTATAWFNDNKALLLAYLANSSIISNADTKAALKVISDDYSTTITDVPVKAFINLLGAEAGLVGVATENFATFMSELAVVVA